MRFPKDFKRLKPRSISKANALSKFVAQWPHENAVSSQTGPPNQANGLAHCVFAFIAYKRFVGCVD
jgi:hypothetical protein